jgi:hypothetical protein
MKCVRTIDVSHPPKPPGEVESILMDGWARVRNSGCERVLKVIHGYGSTGRGGSTRETVRNWLFSQRNRFRSILPGEECSPVHPVAESLAKEISPETDPDLLTPNPGVTFVWIK